MKSKFGLVIAVVLASLVLGGLMQGRSHPNPASSVEGAVSAFAVVTAQQECAACESKCDAWVQKCKDGGQYACYKAAACLCKCNLDAGGCGSSKDALRECYEQNEKLARELGPSSGKR
jgi:hypothetical protein